MRLFVGIFPDEAAIRSWDEFKKNPEPWPVRWMTGPSLHFTIKFLGKTEPAQETAINEVLEEVASSTPPFSLRLKSGGTFPPKGSPSIFWVGGEGDITALFELVRNVEEGFKSIGFPSEKYVYKPHMTVARLADKHVHMIAEEGRDYSAWVARYSSEPFQINRLCLMESHLGPVQSEYILRRPFPFQNGR